MTITKILKMKLIILIKINIKLKICEVLEHFLDNREDFLMTNLLHWFHRYVTCLYQAGYLGGLIPIL